MTQKQENFSKEIKDVYTKYAIKEENNLIERIERETLLTLGEIQEITDKLSEANNKLLENLRILKTKDFINDYVNKCGVTYIRIDRNIRTAYKMLAKKATEKGAWK